LLPSVTGRHDRNQWTNSPECAAYLGVFLFLSILSSTFLTISLFSADEEEEKISVDEVIIEDKKNQPYSIKQININDGKLESGLYVLFGLILAALAFIAGKLSKQ